ncbi:GNAT family N-acetyltransferase [Gephyromycinifex aptenodytis]|uniref:GNAT family N-acetyltransferase n=1 Tax=Gephyromycinifex aptenodytis TaxID=2716227 RepID=UPI00144729BC|nr:GNAT family N-acetyltransferase [Gephyromycinifex aptenodytis]
MSQDTPAPSVPSPGEQAQLPTVRPARIEDLHEIVDLLADDPLGATREGGDLAPYAAAFARITADANQIQVVADLGGQVVGTLQLSFIPSLTRRGTTRAQIEGVRTLSTMRGRGIGEVLLEWALAEAHRRGAGIVQLTSDSTRLNAHRFYERFGFVGSHLGMKLELRRR